MSYIDNETGKPVVFYKESFMVEGGKRARLFDVINHPRLGDCESVITSTIVATSDDGTIETLNTIYKQARDAL